ncbi:hypothetical protein AAY473_029867 [Plecturocebus cupreus]
MALPGFSKGRQECAPRLATLDFPSGPGERTGSYVTSSSLNILLIPLETVVDNKSLLKAGTPDAIPLVSPFSIALLPRLEYNGMISSHCKLRLLGNFLHAQLTFVFIVEMGFHYVGQTGLKLLTSGPLRTLCKQLPKSMGQLPKVLRTELLHFGRWKWVDHLRSGVPDHPGQHGETPFLLKIQKLARHDDAPSSCLSLPQCQKLLRKYFLLERQGLALSPRLERSGVNMLTAALKSWAQAILCTSASYVGTADVRCHPQLIFKFFVEMGITAFEPGERKFYHLIEDDIRVCKLPEATVLALEGLAGEMPEAWPAELREAPEAENSRGRAVKVQTAQVAEKQDTGRSPRLPSQLAVLQEELALTAERGEQQGRDQKVSTTFRDRASLNLRECNPGGPARKATEVTRLLVQQQFCSWSREQAPVQAHRVPGAPDPHAATLALGLEFILNEHKCLTQWLPLAPHLRSCRHSVAEPRWGSYTGYVFRPWNCP